jgi:hypothetical protein
VSVVSPAHRRKWGEAAYAGALLLFGLLGVGGGFKYGLIRTDGIMGPGFIPMLGGGIVCLCTIGIILQQFIGKRPAALESGVEPEPVTIEMAKAEEEIQQASIGKEGSERGVWIVFFCTFVALFLSQWIGLIAALTLLIFAILIWPEREGWKRAVATAAIAGFTAWLIFVQFLDVPILWPNS